MTTPDGQSRTARFFAWLKTNPADAVSAVVTTALIVLALLDVLGTTIDPQWLTTGFIFLAGSITASLLITHESQRHTAARITEIANDLAAVVPSRQMHDIESDAIGSELETQLARASEWTFRGGSARWQRSRVLPVLGAITERTVPYRAQVVDPFNDALCDRYAAYRGVQRKSATRSAKEASGLNIQLDILAFVFALAWHGAHSRIRPQLTLVTTFSPIRVDATLESAVVTVADPAAQGLFAEKTSWYYKALLDEFDQAAELGTVITFPKAPIAKPAGAAAVRKFFSVLMAENKIDPSDRISTFKDADWKKIGDLALGRSLS